MVRKFDYSKRKDLELLGMYSDIINELRKRGTIRTKNNPVADYAEYLVKRNFGYKLQTNSKAGYDAIDNKGKKFQVKSRRIDDRNKSRQLGIIRNLDNKPFFRTP